MSTNVEKSWRESLVLFNRDFPHIRRFDSYDNASYEKIAFMSYWYQRNLHPFVEFIFVDKRCKGRADSEDEFEDPCLPPPACKHFTVVQYRDGTTTEREENSYIIAELLVLTNNVVSNHFKQFVHPKYREYLQYDEKAALERFDEELYKEYESSVNYCYEPVEYTHVGNLPIEPYDTDNFGEYKADPDGIWSDEEHESNYYEEYNNFDQHDDSSRFDQPDD